MTIVVWDGEITEQEATAYLVRLAADPEWPPGPLQLTDVTSATAVIGVLDLELVAELVVGVEPFRLAIVGHGAENAAQIVEKASASAHASVTAHADVASACAWLGVDTFETQAVLHMVRANMQSDN